MSSLTRHSMSVLWPAFLMAGVLEMLVFAFVDPRTLRWMGGELLDLSPTAVYSLAFLMFWAVMTVAGAIMLVLERPDSELNPREPDAR